MKKDYELQMEHIRSIRTLIGESGFERLSNLAAIDKDWDGDDAKSMTTESLLRLIKFLKEVKDPLPNDIGYFFDYEGSISINWEHNGAIVDMLFQEEATYIFYGGLDDCIVIDENRLSELKFYDTENFLKEKQEYYSLISRVSEVLGRSQTNNLIRIANYNYGWGEHGDESPLNMETLETFVLFIESLKEVPNDLIYFPTFDGNMEVCWCLKNNMRHEFDVTPTFIEIFKAPEYESYQVKREDFKHYKKFSDYLLGDFK